MSLIDLSRVNTDNAKGIANLLSTVRDTLVSMGITDIDVCAPAELWKGIQKMFLKWKEQSSDVINNLLGLLGGEFLTNSAMLLAGLTGNSALAWTNTVINEMLFGKILGAYTSLVSAFLAVLPGAEIFLQYLAIKELRLQLKNRTALLSDVLGALDEITKAMASLQFTLFGNTNNEMRFANIRQAMREIKKAKRQLSLEVARNSNNYSGISQVSVTTAEGHINTAITYLLEQKYDYFQDKLNALYAKYNLKTHVPTSGKEARGWIEYFTELANELKQRTDSTQIMGLLFQIIPSAIQALIFQVILTNKLNAVSKLIPINSININNIYNQELADVINISTEPTPTNEIFEGSTLQDTSGVIKLTESTILIFPTMWESVQNTGQVYVSFVSDAETKLQGIYNDISDVILSNPTDFELIGMRVKWAADLNSVKALLLPITSKYASLGIKTDTGTVQINGNDLLSLMANVGPNITKLKQFIVNKTYNPAKNNGAGGSVVEPIDLALNTINSTLGPLMTTPAILLEPNYSRQVSGNINLIKLYLNKQRKYDLIELERCETVINMLEKNPTFVKIKSIMESFIHGLKNTPAGQFSNDLLVGNLSNIMASINGIQAVGDMASMIKCSTATNTPEWLSSISNLLKLRNPLGAINSHEVDAIQRKITSAINKLQDNLTQITLTVDFLKEKFTAITDLQNQFPSKGLTTTDISNTVFNTQIKKYSINPDLININYPNSL